MTYVQGSHGELITLLPDPIFQLPSEGIIITTTIGTEDGRIFQVQNAFFLNFNLLQASNVNK
jgi:hypothetical protein